MLQVKRIGFVLSATLLAVVMCFGIAQQTFQGTITIAAGAYNPPLNQRVAPGQIVQNHLALEKLARQYESDHQGVKIEFQDISVPNEDQSIFVRTRLTAGTAPDIISFYAGPAGSDVDTFLQNGLIVDLSSYMSEPNPYIQGNERWLDTFISPWQQFGQMGSGQYVQAPVDAGALVMYYNKDITSELGLTMPPANWADFMDALGQVKKAGYFGVGYVPEPQFLIQWFQAMVGHQFLVKLVPELDGLNYRPGQLDGQIDAEEWARALTTGGYDARTDPNLIAMIQTLKDWTQFFNVGWTAQNGGNPSQLFRNDRLAFLFSGSWEASGFKQAELPFDYGTFFLPPITRATSPLAPEQPLDTSASKFFTSAYMVAATAAKDPAKLAAIIDFLEYITAPDNLSLFVSEYPTAIPAVVGAQPAPELVDLADTSKALDVTAGQVPIRLDTALATDDATTWLQYSVSYLQGAMSEESFLEQTQQLLLKSAETNIAANDKTKNANGTWDLTKW